MRKQVLVINPKGKGDLHELRAQRLSAFLDADIEFYNVDRKQSRGKATSALWPVVASKNWSLIYQESTGTIGGNNLIKAAKARGQKYIVSSGDPIAGYFKATKGSLFAAMISVYEKELYKNSAGFVGWTPYLTGAAMHLGAPRAVTIEGAVQTDKFCILPDEMKTEARNRFGLPQDHIVLGNVGSLSWNPRAKYSYGLELVGCLKNLKRKDVSILIVGDGSAKDRLQNLVPKELKDRAIFTGRLSEDDVIQAMNTIDIGFITQTLDQLGSFRLTTKLPEYLSCGVAVAMSPIPGFYDYASQAGWALPQVGHHPSDPEFHKKCAEWIDNLSKEEIVSKSKNARRLAIDRFEYNVVGPRFRMFVESLWD